jgi:quinoprotein glucose dehydrogenase
MLRFVLVCLLLSGLVVLASPEGPKSDYNPPLAKESDEGLKAIARFERDKSLQIDLWAAEPMLAQPVAFCFDEKGRCYVAETFRHSRGVTDNRSHMNWLDDELACRTVEERVAMYKKFSGKKFEQEYEKERERVRLLQDTKGKGVADRSTVFRDDFGKAAEGIGAGLLARKGKVYFTCIPDLWVLEDPKETGYADVKKSLSTGYGVHVAFIGHDLHGLRMGPDGKLYFSIGDRGMNVKSKEGKTLFNPDSGAVVRCDLDGSNLEMLHVGLRNPQELAFDDFGNLFTVDNNSDSGDRARFVQIVEGGDSGWRLGYQYGTQMHDKTVKQGNRGPWNYEQIWNDTHPDKPAYVVPPIKNFSDGPSGFAYYPGVGLNSRYNGHFFLSDFRGGPGNSGVWSFTTKPKGATFELVNPQKFVWNILATDCDFGPDGAFYISDWVDGWNLNGKGRIYKITDPDAMKNPAVKEAQERLAQGFAIPEEALLKLLDHPHQQVRLEAQFALAAKGQAVVPSLEKKAKDQKQPLLARLHALWAMGMIRRPETDQVKAVAELLTDAEAEIRAQTAKVLGDLVNPTASPLMTIGDIHSVVKSVQKLLADESSRVRFHAALSLAKLGANYFGDATGDVQVKAEIAVAIYRMLKENANHDPYLRHAGVMALATVGPDVSILSGVKLGELGTPEKLATVLAMRKRNDPAISRYLNDADAKVATEAARAIHDAEIAPALPELAAQSAKLTHSKELLFRSLNAHFRLGKPENAVALAQFAGQTQAPEVLRILALKMLADWSNPPRRDYVTGLTQSLPPREAAVASKALQTVLGKIFSGSQELQQQAAATAGKLGIKEVGPFLFGLLSDAKSSSGSRIEALKALEALKDSRLEESVKLALASDDPLLRTAGRTVLVKTKPTEVLEQLKTVLEKAPLVEQQGAFAILGTMKQPEADMILEGSLDKLLAKSLPAELHLDLLEASAKHNSKSILQKRKQFDASRNAKDDLSNFRETLMGGDGARGRDLFVNHTAAQCQRCHKLDGQGGEVGPPLNGLAAKQNREYLLEAIVLPNKHIAKGYESVQIVTFSGKTVTGIIRSEDKKEVKLITPEGNLITVEADDIESRKATKSGMPDDLAQKLTKSEIRDLVELLAGLKEEWKK